MEKLFKCVSSTTVERELPKQPLITLMRFLQEGTTLRAFLGGRPSFWNGTSEGGTGGEIYIAFPVLVMKFFLGNKKKKKLG